jgi:hypothetical protein
MRDRRYVKLYGIGVDEYEALLKAQRYRCLLCGRHKDELTCNLSVDHDHNTGRVRGLLCRMCNTALEREDSCPGWLDRAKEYLGTSTV